VLWIALRMDVVDLEATPLHLTHRAPFYWAWLCIEMLHSNLDTCKRILRPSRLVRPVVENIEADQTTDLGKVIYANSVTLTPGTLSMHLDNQQLQVHALDQSMIEALKNGSMASRVKRME
jgi:multicomponent Na+:H+ antiporter subunit E